MGQFLVYIGAVSIVLGVVLLVIDSVTYKSRQKKMLEKIEKEFN